MPRFSVIMPAYDVEDVVAPAIRSVLAQTDRDFELIVVDDGSTDATAERIAPFADGARVKLVRTENGGLSAARNAGIAASGGGYLSFVDSDDLLMPRYLEVMGATLDASPRAGVAFTDGWILDAATHRIRRAGALVRQPPPRPVPTDRAGILLALLERNFIYSWATIRRSVVDDVGGFRTDLRSCEDHELWLRAAASGHGVAEAPGRLTIYRRGRPTLTYDAVRMAGASREVCRTVAEDLAVPPVVRVRALDQVRRLDRELAVLAGRRPLAGAARRLKLGLIPLKERALDRRSWYAEPPPEVAAAFPELATGRAPGS